MIYVILGMHKSGTTLVAQMLHNSGINMLDENAREGPTENLYELISTNRRDVLNQTRDKLTILLFERLSTNLINKEILCQTLHRAASSPYHSLNAVFAGPPKADGPLIAKARSIAEECGRNYPQWGFKDPLTCLTYPIWKRVLPEHRLIIVYRHFDQVLQHYRATGWRQANLGLVWKVLRAWELYNRRLVEIAADAAGPFHIANYAALMRDPSELARLSRFVGMDLQDVRRADQYRQRGAGPRSQYWAATMLTPLVPGSPAKLFEQLEATSRAQQADTCRGREEAQLSTADDARMP